MRKLVGASLAILTTVGVLWTLYLAFWVMLIGGICGIIEQVRAPAVDKGELAISILLIVFCEMPLILTAIIGWCGYLFSGAIYFSKPKKQLHPSF